MRQQGLRRKLACGARALALAASAWIASSAGAGPVAGSLSVLVGGLPPLVIPVSGTGTSSTSGVSLPASLFGATVTVPGTTPLISAVQVSAVNGTGAFAGTPLHGLMAIQGNARLRNGGFTAFTIPLTQNGTRGVGLGGSPIYAGSSASPITLSGGEWTVGLVQVTGAGTPGAPLTVSLAGSDQRTAMGAGQLTLVTPMRIRNSALGVTVPAFGVLQLTFAVPEPSAAALLLAAGVLALAGARRARSAVLR